MTNSSNTNKASGGAEAKLRTPTKTPPTKFFGRSSQKKKRLSLSDRKVISPIRKSCSLKSASNSDKGPRGRDRASRLFEDACVSREDLKYVHPEDAANVTPRKSKRIAIKEDEKCARKIEVSDKLQNSKAWKCDSKPQGSLADYWNHKGNRKTTETAVLRNEESADEVCPLIRKVTLVDLKSRHLNLKNKKVCRTKSHILLRSFHKLLCA